MKKNKIKILFVCYGNICRSTMAEMVFEHLIREAHMEMFFEVSSAATSREEIGNGVHYGTRRKLEEEHIPCKEHRAVQMTMEDYDYYDYLIGMDTDNIRRMKKIAGGDPENKMYRLLEFSSRKDASIADPWYTGNFNDTYRDVLEGCSGLLVFLKGKI